MASGAPRATKAAIANPGWNALPGRVMGGGCQGNIPAVQYAHAVPPSRNGGAMYKLEQRAYLSACRMVFEVPSVMSSKRILPCGEPTGGVLLRSAVPEIKPLGA